MKKGHIFFILGVSGAGKGTLITNLKKLEKELNLTFLKSYVTRQKREGEIEGNIYHFISLLEFKKSIENKEFLEYELNHGLYYYGTKYIDIIENGINKGKNVLKEIEVKGLKNIFINNPHLKQYITTIFLDIPEELLVERIKHRGQNISEEELNNRKQSLRIEKIESKELCDYIIDTSEISSEETLEKVLKIINEKIGKSI